MEKEDKTEPVEAPPQELPSSDKWKYTLYTTCIFLLVANPYMYQFVDILFGRFVRIANKQGCPTMIGFLVHALVFTLVLRAIM